MPALSRLAVLHCTSENECMKEEVPPHPGAHLGIMRMKAPPRRKFLLRLSEQLGDAAWQKSVPLPFHRRGGCGLGRGGFVGLACARVSCFVVVVGLGQ